MYAMLVLWDRYLYLFILFCTKNNKNPDTHRDILTKGDFIARVAMSNGHLLCLRNNQLKLILAMCKYRKLCIIVYINVTSYY